ncbi:fimbrial protein [Pseudomonas protegens]|uniref:Fimbrial protein n=1 Tax=Pseudomonas protegens TaxID=380021 RepID=A0A7G8YPA5_9PSED|nr:fimbrial protein [Pseudomonas protegens]QNH77503.1 fimbrial protein [Pseudomonas protegens]QNL06699.1 fimbrial protein [Pseudomonas protegens]
MKLKKIIIHAAFITLSLSSTIASAINCKGDKEKQIINIPGGAISIPLDAPIGTVIYEKTFPSTNAPIRLSCASGSVLKGFKYNGGFGRANNNDSDFPFGKNTGLSFRIYTTTIHGTSPNKAPTYYNYDTGENEPLILEPINYKIKIFKSTEVSEKNNIPAISLGSIIYDYYTSLELRLENPITLNTASCQTPAVSVNMGDDYRLDEFNNKDDAPRTIKFNIGLNQCQSGIKKVTYSLKATTQVLDQKNGKVALSPGSTSKGIGLKLMNEAGQPIALDTTYPYNGFNTTGTSFNIPLSVAYYRLPDGKLEAGTANAEVTFIVSYL